MTKNKSSSKNKRPIYGVGINDSKVPVSHFVKGVRVYNKDYLIWQAMLRRCYAESHLKDYPTYKECSVHPKWHLFSEFQEWLATQDYRGKQLDKDTLEVGNKVYGPDTCCFVTREINMLTRSGCLKTSKVLAGIKEQLNGLYTVKITHQGKIKSLGTFVSIEEAHAVWKLAKARYILQIALGLRDKKICNGLLRHAELLNPKIILVV